MDDTRSSLLIEYYIDNSTKTQHEATTGNYRYLHNYSGVLT